MKKEDIINKLLKVKALADRGSEGERKSAQNLLSSLLKKYGISESDLNDNETNMYLIETGGGIYRQLFVQIYSKKHESDRRTSYDIRKMPKKEKVKMANWGFGDKNADTAIECTKAEFIEAKAIFSIYKADLDNQIKTFLYAYFLKNDLLMEGNDDSKKELDEDEKARLYNSLKMSTGITRKDIFNMIENE